MSRLIPSKLEIYHSLTLVSDPGIDDLVAALLADKLYGGTDAKILSSYGNLPASTTSVNAATFCELASNEWRHIQGTSAGPISSKKVEWAYDFHGKDGTWGVRPYKLARAKINKVSSTTHEQLLSIAPLTELSFLLKKDKISRIFIMGGVFNQNGNQTPHAERNFFTDPQAADKVFEHANRTEINVVPLDVTRQVSWSRKQIKDIPETNQRNIWIKRMLLAWFKNFAPENKNKVFRLHDPLAAYLAFTPSAAEWVSSGVKITTSGPKRGRSQIDENRPPVNIALEIKDPGQVADDIYGKLFF